MKAVVYIKYGPPEVLQIREVEIPTPKNNEILIRIYATAVNATDPIFRKGKPFISRFATGLLTPKNTIPGDVLAGEIEAVGKEVTLFKKGDQVFGATGGGFGAHAEYISLPEEGALALKPANMTYGEAASICDGALTALPFLRDQGKIQRGHKVLINGASGAVGSQGVQLAKYFGAEVTGVCSTANLDLVKSLGADSVIDYTREDFTRTGQSYDIIFDAVGKSSFSRCKRALKPNGIYLTTVLSLAIVRHRLWTSLIGSRKAMIMFTGIRPAKERAEDLRFIKDLAENGKISAVIEKQYLLEQIAEAHRHVETGHKKGNVVVTLDQISKM
ncbi:MAG: NAD(P)-dependent alcohol dehydrogenase [bacterium]|nr:MAG: NAD(P)-dependent alcohol dehydrogenase [bacterium]